VAWPMRWVANTVSSNIRRSPMSRGFHRFDESSRRAFESGLDGVQRATADDETESDDPIGFESRWSRFR
jgi:hypothetical protein